MSVPTAPDGGAKRAEWLDYHTLLARVARASTARRPDPSLGGGAYRWKLGRRSFRHEYALEFVPRSPVIVDLALRAPTRPHGGDADAPPHPGPGAGG
jgi:hypothetical protein